MLDVVGLILLTVGASLVLGAFSGWLAGGNRDNLLGRAAAFAFLGTMIAVFDAGRAQGVVEVAQLRTMLSACSAFVVSYAFWAWLADRGRAPIPGALVNEAPDFKLIAEVLEGVSTVVPIQEAMTLKAAAKLLVDESGKMKDYERLNEALSRKAPA